MIALPPMLARPTSDQLARWGMTFRSQRQYVDARAAYRGEVLRVAAHVMESGALSGPASWPNPADFGLTEDQALRVRRQMAQVLRNRAENHGGRLRV